jgi:NosR/NirI family nitrous oxide reductase transcriptional regulator
MSGAMVEKPSPGCVLTVSGPGRHNPRESFSSVRAYVTVFAFVAAALTVTSGQSPEADLRKQLAQLFPEAASFSPKGGTPPHVKAFGPSGTDKPAPLLGLAYWTTELEPLERGYDGPIKMLVGMDTKGILRGVIVTEHREPYGDFSVDRPEFAAQFKKKDIRDPFRVGADIDAVSRATITVTSASRAVRNSSRRIARALLTPPESSK